MKSVFLEPDPLDPQHFITLDPSCKLSAKDSSLCALCELM